MFENGLAYRSNPGDRELNEKVIVIMMNIVMNTNSIPIVQELFKYLHGLYIQYSKKAIADKQIVLDEILGLSHTCLLAIGRTAIPKPEFKDMVFYLIDEHIKHYGIETEVINLISAAASCYKKDFRVRMDQLWSHILMGLEMVDQKILFKATLSCLSDIARNH